MSEVSDRFWYRSYYGSEIAVMPWAEDTAADLEFIGRFAPLSSPLQILDLACGMGRHAIALAARGHLVTAVDISPDLIDGALASAEREGVDVNFICSDIREVDAGQYDLVLNLWEGAIGYLESEAENLRIFEVIGASLRPGGIHVAGPLINRDFVEQAAPFCIWEDGFSSRLETEIAYDSITSRIIDSCWVISQGKRRSLPSISYRVYSPCELRHLLDACGARTVGAFAQPGKINPASARDFEYWNVARKE